MEQDKLMGVALLAAILVVIVVGLIGIATAIFVNQILGIIIVFLAAGIAVAAIMILAVWAQMKKKKK
jgi:hypothetical protein